MDVSRPCRHPLKLGVQDMLPNTSREHEYPTSVSLATAPSLGYGSQPFGAQAINCYCLLLLINCK